MTNSTFIDAKLFKKFTIHAQTLIPPDSAASTQYESARDGPGDSLMMYAIEQKRTFGHDDIKKQSKQKKKVGVSSTSLLRRLHNHLTSLPAVRQYHHRG